MNTSARPMTMVGPHVTGPLTRRRVLVVGLGRFGGGLGVTQWLASQGAEIVVTDQSGADDLRESVAALDGCAVTFHLGGHDERDLDWAELVVVNPAVDKAKSAFFQAIVRRGAAWTTEINLFCERCPATVFGVTGTYGKSTTCAMLAEVFGAASRAGKVGFRRVHLGGNIGRSLLTELADMDERDLVVLEMSNAQLEDLPRIAWGPDLAVITNLFPHHLDRHATFEEYARAKLNIVRNPRGGPVITGELEPPSEVWLADALVDRGVEELPVASRLIRGALAPAPPTRGGATLDGRAGVPEREGAIGRRVRIERPDPAVKLRVPGSHNQANAACVLTVCRTCGLDEQFAREALAGFAGLPHRLEFVRTLDGVDYYNDSKSTAPAATVVALEAIARPTVALVGGQLKDVSRVECAISLARHCRVVIGFGESGPAFADAVRAIGSPRVTVRVVANVEEAVAHARNEAGTGEVVLFSPGAPSFDAYRNFTERGRHFAELVRGL